MQLTYLYADRELKDLGLLHNNAYNLCKLNTKLMRKENFKLNQVIGYQIRFKFCKNDATQD